MKRLSLAFILLAIYTVVAFAKEPSIVSKPIELDAAEFVKKVHDFKKSPNQFIYVGEKPAIIDFHATWCGPCKQLAPTLEALAAEYSNDIYVYKVDVDKEPDIARAYGIRSVPSLLFIPHDDAVPQMGQGNMPKESLKKVIDEFMLGKRSNEVTE